MQEQGNAIAFLIAGLAIAAILLWRMRRGVGYWSRPAAKFTRADGPFSFWLSMLLPGALAALLLIAGVGALLQPWMR